MPPSSTIDLRSDTVTKATPEMRQAMAQAEVGDEMRYGDPTAQRLEVETARLTGHEAALFCTSGTMGNLVAFMCHCRPGDSVIAESTSHFLLYESAGVSAVAGAIPHTLPGTAGRMNLDMLDEAIIEAGSPHKPPTSLIVAENTHNLAGGTCLDPAYMKRLWQIAGARGVSVHLDGARVWNAAVALGVPVSTLTSGCDSVMVDLSKGLCAPYGSLLCGSAAFIERARDMRQRIGGGVRQIGHMAAAGLIAIETMIDRLAEDYAKARRLAAGIREARAECVNLDLVETNIVIVETAPLGLTGAELVARLEETGILCHAMAARRIRLVTHRDIDDDMIENALDGIIAVIEATSR